MSSRRCPLQTCAVSFVAIAHSAISRAQNHDGRLGSTTRKMIQLANTVSPLIFALQYQCVLVLTFIDDGLLATANIVEKIFPPSKLLFDKIDDLLHLIETFPVKFDDAVEKLPCFNQVLLLDWAVTHAISLLKFMITLLMNFGKDGTREKEILVDMNCNKGRNGSESAHKSECCTEGTISSVSETQNAMKSEAIKNTSNNEYCKENQKGIYKVGDKEDCKNDEKGLKAVEEKESSKKDEKNESQVAKMEESVGKAEAKEEIPDHSNGEKEEEGGMDYEHGEENKGSIEKEEDILELFETAWLMKPTGKGRGNLMPRSASYV